MRNRAKLAGVCAASLAISCLSLAPRANASIYTLPVGGNIVASSSTFPSGGTVLDTVVSPFTSSTIDGTITSTVISGDSSNPYGGLTFEYSVFLNNFSSDSLSTLTVGSYGGFAADVSYAVTGTNAPSNFTRSPASNDGSTLRFLWSNNGGLQPGNTGSLVVVQTGAHSYTPALGSVIDSQSVNINTLAPLAVPEPGIVSLLIAGFGVFALWRRNSK